MRVLVTGDRDWYDFDMVGGIVARLVERYGPDLVIVHGGATGVDTTFEMVAMKEEIATDPHLANWEKYGNSGGPIRNQAMIDAGADLCIAVHRFIANSKGTKDCARRAIAAGIPTYLIASSEAIPERLTGDDPRLGR